MIDSSQCVEHRMEPRISCDAPISIMIPLGKAAPHQGDFLLLRAQLQDVSDVGMRVKSSTRIDSTTVWLQLHGSRIVKGSVVNSRKCEAGGWEYGVALDVTVDFESQEPAPVA